MSKPADDRLDKRRVLVLAGAACCLLLLVVGLVLWDTAPGMPVAAWKASQTTAAPSTTTSSAIVGRVNVNTATLEELQQLSGVGEVIAQRIVFYRQQIGGFTSVEQLADVRGISPTMVDSWRPYITL